MKESERVTVTLADENMQNKSAFEIQKDENPNKIIKKTSKNIKPKTLKIKPEGLNLKAINDGQYLFMPHNLVFDRPTPKTTSQF